ncbi:hypothetical protein LINPERPRIM_LOCUS8921 [Linum perenne]
MAAAVFDGCFPEYLGVFVDRCSGGGDSRSSEKDE